jgi:hypothetical protein
VTKPNTGLAPQEKYSLNSAPFAQSMQGIVYLELGAKKLIADTQSY